MKKLVLVLSLGLLSLSLVSATGCNRDSGHDEEKIVDTPDTFSDRCLRRGTCRDSYYSRYDDIFYPYDYSYPYSSGFRGCPAGYYPVYDPYDYGLGCISTRYVSWDYSWSLWQWDNSYFTPYRYSTAYWASYSWSFPGYNYVLQSCVYGSVGACGSWGSCVGIQTGVSIGLCRW